MRRRNLKYYRDLISGREQGWRAALGRGALRLAEPAYRLGVQWRNRRYDRGATIQRVGVPVISVGNLTVGGTGKTPMVAWIARWFREHGMRVTLISRGYGAQAGAQNDEAMELEQQLPDVPHLQNPDRVAAAQLAIEEFECQLILLDDAFQHRRLHRDLDIVLIDALEPFGYGHLLPRGLLREPISSLRRANIIALCRADLVDDSQRAEVASVLQRHAPGAQVIEVAHRPTSLVGISGETRELSVLRGRSAAAFCGLGNPLGFRRTLESCGVNLIDFREFPDHHAYNSDDVQSIAAWADSLPIDLLLCTMKDFVKLRAERIGKHRLRALAIGIEILTGRAELEKQLARFVIDEEVS